MRFLSSLIAVALLTVACGADGSDVVSDDLALAQQEIARLEALLAEQSEVADTEEPAASEVSGTPYSVGPCGVFALNGTRVVELSYELGEDGHIQDDPPPAWTDTGIEVGDVFMALSEEPLWIFDEGRSWLARQPNYAFGVQLVPGLNHAWFLSWQGWAIPRPPRHLAGLYYEGQGLDGKYDWWLADFERIVGNRTSYSGFFGLDENCEWSWIKKNGAFGFMLNASIRLTEGENGEPEIATLYYKDTFCGWGDYYQMVYDPEEHNFVTQCHEAPE